MTCLTWAGIIAGGYGLMYLAFRWIDKRLTLQAQQQAREALIQAHVSNIDTEWERINRP